MLRRQVAYRQRGGWSALMRKIFSATSGASSADREFKHSTGIPVLTAIRAAA
jgi:hypothetical protein